MTFLKILSHESNRNNEILKYALYFAKVHLIVIVNDRKQGLCKKSGDLTGNNELLETSNYIARKQNLW